MVLHFKLRYIIPIKELKCLCIIINKYWSMTYLVTQWVNEDDICACKSSCNCGAFRNTPDLEIVEQLLELKNNTLTLPNGQYSLKRKCQRRYYILENKGDKKSNND